MRHFLSGVAPGRPIELPAGSGQSAEELQALARSLISCMREEAAAVEVVEEGGGRHRLRRSSRIFEE
eukprot:scaffold90984_cov18-Phaeocystis_antarctica.AAC.1